MAIFSLEIDDADVQRVFDAVCGNYHWRALVDNPDYVGEGLDSEGNPVPAEVDSEGNPVLAEIDNPESMGEFTHRMVRDFLSSHVASWEIKEAKRIASENLDTSIGLGEPVE
jgi:hypothetical protein